MRFSRFANRDVANPDFYVGLYEYSALKTVLVEHPDGYLDWNDEELPDDSRIERQRDNFERVRRSKRG